MQQSDSFLQEHTFYPFARGSLVSSTASQFSTAVEATDGTTLTLVESVTLNPGGIGALEEAKFYLTASFKSDSSAKAMNIQWDAKSTDSTVWVNLAEATQGDATTTYLEYTVHGYKGPVDNLQKVPINVRCRFHGEDATCHSDCRTKNSSYVTLKWRPGVQ